MVRLSDDNSQEMLIFSKHFREMIIPRNVDKNWVHRKGGKHENKR